MAHALVLPCGRPRSLADAGLIAAFEGEAFFAGVYFYGWTSDPTAGGPSDMTYTPRGKPAEKTVFAWFAARNGRPDGAAGARLLPSIADELTALTKEHVKRSRSDAAAVAANDRTVVVPNLLNNTRLAVEDTRSGIAKVTLDACVKLCVNDASCGGIVYREPFE